ncbi:MAG: hypothetical protein HOO06_01935 [Bdellovibrionaceae bacterium]|nr:hypothetical protein [Pseudobdellovibrionaceae bacterium]
MKSMFFKNKFTASVILVAIILTGVFLVAPTLIEQYQLEQARIKAQLKNLIDENIKVAQRLEDSKKGNSDDQLEEFQPMTLKEDSLLKTKRIVKKKFTKKQIFDKLKGKIWTFKKLSTKKYGNCNNIAKLKKESKSVSLSSKKVEFKSANALVIDGGRYLSNFLFDEEKQMIYLDVGDNLRESIFSLSGRIIFNKNKFKIIHQAKVDDFDCNPRTFQFLEEYNFSASKALKLGRKKAH